MRHCGKPTDYGPCIRKEYHRGDCKAAKENRPNTRDYSDVSFVYRLEPCTDCGRERNRGYYYTGPAPEYEIKFVCRDCA